MTFTVTGANPTSGSAVTDANGRATFCYTGAMVGNDAITATAQGGTNPSDTAQKTWVAPASTTGCKITNGGNLTAANGDKANQRLQRDGAGQGQQEYQDKGLAQAMNVKAINVQAVVCNAAGTAGSIFGQATINGSGTFNYRIDVQDLGEPGTIDTYRIPLSNGYDSGVKVISGGNIQIQ